jgi:hypothetical protein
MARLICGQCKATLSRPDARCRNCGWARDYRPGDTRRERVLALRLGLGALALITALVIFVERLLVR